MITKQTKEYKVFSFTRTMEYIVILVESIKSYLNGTKRKQIV